MSLQKPIETGFNDKTTADEVLGGIDLKGKTAVITGGHSGIGLESTSALASAGARIIVGARNTVEAQKALSGISGVTVLELDLSDLNSVKRFAAHIVSSGQHTDMLINSAGIMANPEKKIGPKKWEAQFATNHLGHFLLVNEMWPSLIGGSRVISVSSSGHHISGIRWDDIHFERGYDKWQAYGQSKTANALFAVHLDQLGEPHGVRAFSLHPGKILTPLVRHMSNEEKIAEGWIDENGVLIDPTFKTPEQGAATQIWAATSPLLDGLGGVYCEDCDIAKIDEKKEATFAGVKKYAIDPVAAKRLWEISADLTGAKQLA